MTDTDEIFKKMLAEYVQELVENDCRLPDVVEGLNLRCFFDFIEAKGYIRANVTPADEKGRGMTYWGGLNTSNDAMEDADNREARGDNLPFTTSSTTDGDAEKALKALDLMRMRCYSHAKISNSEKDMRDWIDSDYEIIKAALQTRTPPAKPSEMVCSGDYACGGKCKNCTPPVPVDTISIKREVAWRS